jgi:ribose 5-phosphate isomerase B
MKIYLGADHNGFDYKQEIIERLRKSGHDVVDEAAQPARPDDDYPILAAKTIHSLLADNGAAQAILICGSGQGMCMAANRFKGVRASLCWSVAEAKAARNDDDSNVLCLAARYTAVDEAETIINVFLNTPFAGATRFKRRIQQLDELP